MGVWRVAGGGQSRHSWDECVLKQADLGRASIAQQSGGHPGWLHMAERAEHRWRIGSVSPTFCVYVKSYSPAPLCIQLYY